MPNFDHRSTANYDDGTPYSTLPDRSFLSQDQPAPTRTNAQRFWRYMKRRVRILEWGPEYSVTDNLLSDIIGGLTIGMVCLAQTLAHAAIATTETIQGPYCAFVPTLLYVAFGTSPHASVSSGAIAAILIADQLRPWPDIQDRTELASLLALISGITLILMGFFKLAFAVRFLSLPTLSGFITGGSILIIVQQLKNLFGFREFPHTNSFKQIVEQLILHVPEIDWVSTVLGCIFILILEAFNRVKARLNERIKDGDAVAAKYKRLTEMKEIVVTVLGTLFGYLTATPGGEPTLATVGTIPSGLPGFQKPWEIRTYNDLVNDHDKMINFIVGGVLVAFTTFLTTFATTKKAALKFGYTLDPSQEMIALGAAGIGGSFFRAFPPSGSLSRTGLAADCGVKTQLGGVFAAAVIGVGLCFLTPALLYLPKASLAAIIIKSTSFLVDFSTPVKLWQSWKPKSKGGLKRDFIIWVIAFTMTLAWGVLYGIGCAVIVSICLIVADAAAPQPVVLGSFKNRFLNIADWPEAKVEPGILVFDFRGPLSFASAEWFQQQIENARIDQEARTGVPIQVVVLSAYSVHYLDATALAMLEEVLTEWRQKKIACIIAGARHQVRLLIQEKLASAKPPLLEQTDFFLSIQDAVDLARQRISAREERADPAAQIARKPISRMN